MHAQLGNKNLHDITHGRSQVELQIKVSIRIKPKNYFSKVPVYSQSSMRTSKMLLIVFFFGAGNKILFGNLLNDI